MTQFDYMKQAIQETISGIKDEDLLRYLYTMIMVSIHEEKHQEDS